MKIRAGILLFFVVAVLVSGCISVSYTMLGPGYPPVPESEVQFFSVQDELPEHTRVALLYLTLDLNNIASTNPGKLISMLSNKAGALGANGIVVTGVKEMGDGVWVVTDATRMVANMDELDTVLPGGRVSVDAIAIRVE